MLPRALTVLALLAAALADNFELIQLTDEQYYSMPALFELDPWAACRAVRGIYCVGSFELTPELTQPGDSHQLYDIMKSYSSNWVDYFNHTRVHRGLCLQHSCSTHAPRDQHLPLHAVHDWFSRCVNASTSSSYNLSARLVSVEECRDQSVSEDAPLSGSGRALVTLTAALLALAAVSTVLEATLTDHAKKAWWWSLCWSLQGSWRVLRAPPAGSCRSDLRALDGLRVFTMAVVIVEHVTWITTHAYLADPRTYEQLRQTVDGRLLSNSTLVVQIFFIMSSFLLTHKLLQQRRKGEHIKPVSTFIDTMVNRIVRVSPSYFMVVWFAASWWERLGEGPLWAGLVREEAAVCRDKWWTHLLYLNNVLRADDKCLIQTWYLAADMQLYALCLLLTLLLWRWRRGALFVLTSLLVLSLALLFALAYHWRLVPTLVMHRPESVRVSYRDEPSFNVLYQSPLANVPGALAGMLLAHIHHTLLDHDVQLHQHKVLSWLSVLSVPVAAWWVTCSPLVLGRGPPDRLVGAALAVLERPVFAFFVAFALLGAMNGVDSAVRRIFSWSGWSCWARLSFGALLLHMPLNKALVASRLMPSQLDRGSVLMEWGGVAALSYLAALPLALLVEVPAQRLQRALSPRAPPRAAPAPHTTPLTDKSNL